MSIKFRIIATLTLLFILMLCISSYGPVVNLIKSSSIEDALLEGKIVQIQHLMEKNRGQLALSLQHFPNFEYAKLHNHPVENHLKVIDENSALIKEAWDNYQNNIQDPDEKTLANTWYTESEELGSFNMAKASDHIRKAQWEEAEYLLLGQVAKNYVDSAKASNALSAYIAKRLKTETEEAESQIYMANMALIAVVIVAFLVSIFSTISLIRNIIPPLNRAIEVTRRISGGDLTQEITVGTNNEIGHMLTAIRDMNGSLSDIVGQVRNGSDSIAISSAEIAAGNMDLSSRTEQQAASLEETASSVEEMTQMVRQNTEKATEANNLARDASQIATEAGSVVSEVVDTMTVINDSSRKIVDIISVIDGIAFQTNILALNAAVEAARAGEQGRGFAVVATEVRSLAQRSANAAREIKSLIDDSVVKVNQGSELVNRAGSIMDRVVHSIKDVNTLMSEITMASQEQSAGIEQINIAISQMDEVTQQNAALVEESAAAAQSLRNNAEGLKKMVGTFHLRGDIVHGKNQALIAHNQPVALTYDSSEEENAA